MLMATGRQQKLVHLVEETCTCYPGDMHMLPERHVHVTRETCTCYLGDMHILPGRHAPLVDCYVSIKVDNVAGLQMAGDGFKQGVQDGANIGTTDGA